MTRFFKITLTVNLKYSLICFFHGLRPCVTRDCEMDGHAKWFLQVIGRFSGQLTLLATKIKQCLPYTLKMWLMSCYAVMWCDVLVK